jgi:hypothetical protein
LADAVFPVLVLAGQVDPAATEERRPVPGKPEVPPDVWLSLTVPG